MNLKNNKKRRPKPRVQIQSGTFLNPFLLSDLLGFNRLIIAYMLNSELKARVYAAPSLVL